MQKQTTYVGMDVHARTIRVAVLRPNEAQREEWGLANEPRAVASLARRLLREARGPVVACYEAGPTLRPELAHRSCITPHHCRRRAT